MPRGWPSGGNSESGDKLYPKPGKAIRVQIIEEEPELYYTHFVNNKSTKCEGELCGHCSSGVKKSEKGAIGVIDQEDGKEKSLCGTAALFKALKATIDMCGGSKGLVFAVMATGEGKDRRYNVTNVPIPAGLSKIIKSAEQSPVATETYDESPFA